jgi:hypothetical protein
MKISQKYPVLSLILEAADYKGPQPFRYIRACFLTPYYTTQLNPTHRRWIRFCSRTAIKSTRLIEWAAGIQTPNADIASKLLNASKYQAKFLALAEEAAMAEVKEAFAKLREERLAGEQWLQAEYHRLLRARGHRKDEREENLRQRMIMPTRPKRTKRRTQEEEDFIMPQLLLARMERQARAENKEEDIPEDKLWNQAEIAYNLDVGEEE